MHFTWQNSPQNSVGCFPSLTCPPLNQSLPQSCFHDTTDTDIIPVNPTVSVSFEFLLSPEMSAEWRWFPWWSLHRAQLNIHTYTNTHLHTHRARFGTYLATPLFSSPNSFHYDFPLIYIIWLPQSVFVLL